MISSYKMKKQSLFDPKKLESHLKRLKEDFEADFEGKNTEEQILQTSKLIDIVLQDRDHYLSEYNLPRGSYAYYKKHKQNLYLSAIRLKMYIDFLEEKIFE